jgi:predicted nucleic acid-binding protein
VRVVYVDSGAFIALLWRRDRAHERCAEHLRRLRRGGDVLVTTEAVVAETTTRLRYDAGLGATLRFHRVLDEAALRGELRLRYGDDRLRNAALELMARHPHLKLSYADAVGAVVARDVRAAAVFGLDDDFRQLGFALEP